MLESPAALNQTGSPAWFGVETSSSFYDQRLFAKLSARAVQWTARVEAFSKLPPRAGPSPSSKNSSSSESAVYGCTLYCYIDRRIESGSDCQPNSCSAAPLATPCDLQLECLLQFDNALSVVKNGMGVSIHTYSESTRNRGGPWREN